MKATTGIVGVKETQVAYSYIRHQHHHGFLVDKFGDIDLTSWSKEEETAKLLIISRCPDTKRT